MTNPEVDNYLINNPIEIKHVYVSGPFTSNPAKGTRSAIDTADELFDQGFIPFVPHLYLFWDISSPHSYDEWMDMCLAWVPKCDALVRLPGLSSGADREVECAKKHCIPVLDSVESLVELVLAAERAAGLTEETSAP